MSNLYSLEGSYTSAPASGLPSGDPEVDTTISEQLYLRRQKLVRVELSTDSPVAVGFDNIAAAAVVIVKSVGNKVSARITSADGTTQAVPVDSLLILHCSSVGVTALDLTRVAGAGTVNVIVFLGEKS